MLKAGLGLGLGLGSGVRLQLGVTLLTYGTRLLYSGLGLQLGVGPGLGSGVRLIGIEDPNSFNKSNKY